MEFGEQVTTLDTAITEENERLEKLLKEREVEAAEVVSVNIGKKKHRVKKGLEAEAAAQKEAAAASTAKLPAPAAASPKTPTAADNKNAKKK